MASCCVCASSTLIMMISGNGEMVHALQNESLNGGGTLFVNKRKDLRIRVVHGNTLTAAVILDALPKNVKEIFLTGATSKLGRAIAIYLCRRGVRVMVSLIVTILIFFAG